VCHQLLPTGLQKKIFLVDKDVVDVHNLNRQVIYSLEDIGVRKVTACARNLEHLHNLRTQIVEVDVTDAVDEWPRLVELTRQCTCIFNCIDRGDYWDFAVQSLAIALNLPMVDGGTEPVYGHMASANLWKRGGKPCWSCGGELENKEVCRQLTPDKILTLPNLAFLPRNETGQAMDGGSNVYTCCIAAHTMCAQLIQYLIGYEGIEQPNRVLVYLQNFTMDNMTVATVDDCLLCGVPHPRSS
jgi:hypothetical protein